ncbi:MAG TPA: hypothetical protein VEA69_16060 [Tepidisphaeraceae bacterium]|nr:hypothetical protein [Tepidisphaeraceae bacterium]
MPSGFRLLAARRILALSALGLGLFASTSTAQPADPTPIKGFEKLNLGADAPPVAGNLLAENYENPVAGISFRPPAGCTIIKKQPGAEGNVIAEFAHDERQWLLKVTKLSLGRPMLLQSVKGDPVVEKDPKTGQLVTRPGGDSMGLLDWTVAEIMKTNRTAVVERQEIVNVREYAVGIAILHITLGTEKFLRQQAIFQVDDQNYFVFNLTTPAAKTGKPEDDAGERLAAEGFKQMLDTIQVLDQSWIRKDQVQRLFRTRALFVEWGHNGGKRIRDAMIPEQWLRLVKDGKDIGYSVVYEDFIEGRDVRNNPGRMHDGVLISIRSRTVDGTPAPAADGKPAQGTTQVDVGSQLFTSLSRKHEDWAHVVNVVTEKGTPKEDKTNNAEFGFSELAMVRKVDRENLLPNPKDPKAPPMRDVESYRLSVTRPNRDKRLVEPEYYTPSPWYIPQAVGVMLPRLIPVNKAHTYLFQTYVGDQRAVVHRYVDVGFEKEVTIDGKQVRAVPITDRVRLEGAVTIHYMSPDGKWLASFNEEAKVTILPTDEATLRKIWGAPADLSKPAEIERPGQRASTGSPVPVAPRN